MDLIDKGTHMEDEHGNRFARADSTEPPKRLKKAIHRTPAFWDTVFGLYVEHKAGNLLLSAIAKEMKITTKSIVDNAYRREWGKKAEIILKKRQSATEKELSVKPIEMVAASLVNDQNEFRGNVSELLVKASQTVKKMTPRAYLNKTKEVKEMVDTAEKVQGWKKEDEKTVSNAPVLNVAFLLGAAMPVSVSATAGDAPRQD